MSYSNGLLPSQDLHHDTFYGKGEKGDPDVGFRLTDNGAYDIQNKKLVNVKQGTNNNDVVTKSQIQLLEGTRGGYVTNNKGAIYSGTGALHAQSLFERYTR